MKKILIKLKVSYIKDLLPHFDNKNYSWENVVREPFLSQKVKKLMTY